MRLPALFAVAVMGLAPAAFANALEVEVKASPGLARLAEEKYGPREVDSLLAELKRDVTRELERTGALAGARVELTLVDARPNRPTFKELGDTPALSYQSFGLGGAKIEGQVIAADGTVTPVSYGWYETDITQSAFRTTWGDAHWTINRFASQLAKGRLTAQR